MCCDVLTKCLHKSGKPTHHVQACYEGRGAGWRFSRQDPDSAGVLCSQPTEKISNIRTIIITAHSIHSKLRSNALPLCGYT